MNIRHIGPAVGVQRRVVVGKEPVVPAVVGRPLDARKLLTHLEEEVVEHVVCAEDGVAVGCHYRAGYVIAAAGDCPGGEDAVEAAVSDNVGGCGGGGRGGCCG